jgi:hypothetical protein
MSIRLAIFHLLILCANSDVCFTTGITEESDGWPYSGSARGYEGLPAEELEVIL